LGILTIGSHDKGFAGCRESCAGAARVQRVKCRWWRLGRAIGDLYSLRVRGCASKRSS
jgi:hypothetical protein